MSGQNFGSVHRQLTCENLPLWVCQNRLCDRVGFASQYMSMLQICRMSKILSWKAEAMLATSNEKSSLRGPVCPVAEHARALLRKEG